MVYLKKCDYVPPRVDFSKKMGGSKTLPKQSLTPREIVDRFTKGMPINVGKKEGVYMDHNNTDYERISRMDFAEKHEVAREQASFRNEVMDAAKQAIEQAKRAKESESAAKKPKSQKPVKRTDIDDLDNTMSVDTDADTQ